MHRKVIFSDQKKPRANEENILFAGRTIHHGPLKVDAKELDGKFLKKYPGGTVVVSIP